MGVACLPHAHIFVTQDEFAWHSRSRAYGGIVRIEAWEGRQLAGLCVQHSRWLRGAKVLPRAKWPISMERPFATLMWLRWGIARQALHTSSCVLAKGKTKPAVKAPSLLPNDWEAVIGIECHAQLLASTKLFSGK